MQQQGILLGLKRRDETWFVAQKQEMFCATFLRFGNFESGAPGEIRTAVDRQDSPQELLWEMRQRFCTRKL